MSLTKEECKNYNTHCDGNWTSLMQPKTALIFLLPFHIVSSYSVCGRITIFKLYILHSTAVQYILVPLMENLAFASVKFQSVTFNPFV